ncbi:cullin, putative [Theileria annulata]|uniref:Cullin, putative n=1 Tax=Theileria annulata TaxID=5874 RepID=Q4UBB6_THEAN|nr:cullin, putative [Theileria annulata]CAI75885.1 cullin, putative [Theileria annulata]|eukprot:XP_955361.1 cullin, putative [Theileria annulata]
MELLKHSGISILDSSIQNENCYDINEIIGPELDDLKRFITSVLSGRDSSGFCRLKLQEFVRECDAYGKTEFLINEIDDLLDNLLVQLLSEIDDNFGRNVDKRPRAKRSSSSKNSPEHFNLLSKFEVFWCRIRTGIVEAIKFSLEHFNFSIKVVDFFKRDVNERSLLYENLQTGALNLIASHRTGTPVDFSQLRNIINFFISIGVAYILVFFINFEVKLLKGTTRFYNSLSRDYMNSYSNVECFTKFDSAIKFEKKICESFLIEETVAKVIQTVKNELLYTKSNSLIGDEKLKKIIRDNDLDTLILINSLYSNSQYIPLFLDNIFKSFKEIFCERMAEHMNSKDYEKSDLFVKDIREYQEKIEKYVRPMTTQSDYNTRIKKFWVSIFTSTDSAIEYISLTISKFCDELHLKSTMTDFTSKIKFFVFIFQFLPNKSYFEMCLRTFLTMRLLYHKYLDQSHVNIIKILEKECGPDYTCKLIDLIDFHQKSKKLVTEFCVEDRFNFSLVLVNKDCWIHKNIKEFDKSKEFNDSEVVEAAEVEDKSTSFQSILNNPKYDAQEGTTLEKILELQNDFKTFYELKYNKKLLQYLTHLGSAVLEIDIKGRVHELKVSAYQAYCLLLFNNYKYLTLSQLESKLNDEYDDATVRNQLSILEDNGLIRFYNPERTFITCSKNDYFELNLNLSQEAVDFMPKKEELFNINMNYTVTKSTFDDMMLYIESTIMLYLKQTLESSSSTIFKLFSKNPNFTLSRQQFNRIVDSLIAREFIKYSESNKEVLQYVP